MSTLTKILIVLLTLSSIFLCGVVVTYVAHAENFKQTNKRITSELSAETEKSALAQKQEQETTKRSQRLEAKLNAQITALKTGLTELKSNLLSVGREKASLLAEVEKWTSMTKEFHTTNDKQRQLLENALNEMKTVGVEQIENRKELKELSTSLLERMAVIESLEAEKRRLLEEKVELRESLDKLLMPAGVVTAPPQPVTLRPDQVRKVVPSTEIGLRGLITNVDVANSMASISLGSADGIKAGMEFHITRSNTFICDLHVIHVDIEESVGMLKLVQQQPRIGDNAATNF